MNELDKRGLRMWAIEKTPDNIDSATRIDRAVTLLAWVDLEAVSGHEDTPEAQTEPGGGVSEEPGHLRSLDDQIRRPLIGEKLTRWINLEQCLRGDQIIVSSEHSSRGVVWERMPNGLWSCGPRSVASPDLWAMISPDTNVRGYFIGPVGGDR